MRAIGAFATRHTSRSSASLPERRPRAERSRLHARLKVTLFARLFAGRLDVFPLRWENTRTGRSGYAPACGNEWVKGVCYKPQIKCGECRNQAFLPVTHDVIANHLRGRAATQSSGSSLVMGVYPLLSDNTCWFLAADFDGEQWAADSLAYLETCRRNGIPVALERSRSGNGGHAWIFFAEPVPARDARQLGALLLTETMERRPEIGFDSYDRFFPSQDTMPVGGFGNLIALPLQRAARERGNSEFVDDQLQPIVDQWAFLSGLPRLTRDALTAHVREAEKSGRVLGVRMPIADEDADQPWLLPPSRRRRVEPIAGILPSHVELVLADDIYIDRSSLPPAMVALLVRLTAFQNPEFYRAQAMRMSTHGKPRIISCAALHPRHVALPRGCLDEVLALLRSCDIEPRLDDRREGGEALPVRFLGTLRDEQVVAFNALAGHDQGVIAAPPAFGKTVVAAALIAQRACNTLVLVHRRELLTQWIERLREFLSVEPGDIGSIGGGRRKPTRRIDVALIQSLVRKGEVSDLVAGYGHLADHLHAVRADSIPGRPESPGPAAGDRPSRHSPRNRLSSLRGRRHESSFSAGHRCAAGARRPPKCRHCRRRRGSVRGWPHATGAHGASRPPRDSETRIRAVHAAPGSSARRHEAWRAPCRRRTAARGGHDASNHSGHWSLSW